MGDRGMRTLVGQPREHHTLGVFSVVPTNPSPPQGLPVEGDPIDTKAARRNHAKIRRVPAHREQSPDPLQLAIAFQ